MVRDDVRVHERREDADLVLHLVRVTDGARVGVGLRARVTVTAGGLTFPRSARSISCTAICLLTTMWPVRRWRRSTAVPKEPFPSVLTVSYSPKVPLASCAALGAASFHTSRKPRLGNVRVRLPLRRCRGEPITAIPGGVVGTPSCAAESLLDCWGVASGIGWNSLFRPKSECRLNSGGGSGGSGGGSCLPQLGDDAGDGLPPVGKVVDGLTSRDCTPSTSSIASDSQSIASAREIDALVGGRGELSRDAGGPRCPVGSC